MYSKGTGNSSLSLSLSYCGFANRLWWPSVAATEKLLASYDCITTRVSYGVPILSALHALGSDNMRFSAATRFKRRALLQGDIYGSTLLTQPCTVDDIITTKLNK